MAAPARYASPLAHSLNGPSECMLASNSWAAVLSCLLRWVGAKEAAASEALWASRAPDRPALRRRTETAGSD